MEGSYLLLFIAVVLSIATVIAVIIGAIKSLAMTEDVPAKRKASSHFVREGIVSGYLVVDGRKIPTFNTGLLRLDNGVITLTFYQGFNTPVRVTDILMNQTSVYSFLSPNSTEQERKDYVVQVLKHSANQGGITHDLASEVEQILLEVASLNAHLKAGEVVNVPGTVDFAWHG